MVVDQTGGGRVVIDLLSDGLRGQVTCTIWPDTLGAGPDQTAAEDGIMPPKKELVGVLQVLLQTRRLHIASALPDAPLLVKELANFKARVSLARNEPAEDWREGRPDDLVFAVGLAAWAGEQVLPPLEDPPEEPLVTQLIVM